MGIIQALTFHLGVDNADMISDIASHNTFLEKPIIALPNNRGYFIPNLYTVAIAMNEAPYYWISESTSFSAKQAGNIRGKMAEDVVYNILANKFHPKNIGRDIEIKKTKSSNVLTDIDLYVRHFNAGVVFQVKSKKITEKAKQGDEISIENDFKKAVINAYQQGQTCVDCIAEYTNYYSLKSKSELFKDITSRYCVCVVLDAYPTLSTLSYMHLCVNYGHNGVAQIPMTAFDLDIAIRFFSPDEFIEYLQFRVECSKKAIYGISEAYYLGAYIYNAIFASIYTETYNKIPREYAIFLDYIENIRREKKLAIQCIADIKELLVKYPPPDIQCQ